MTITTHPNRRRLVLGTACAIVGAVVLAACGDDTSDDAGTTTTVDAELTAFCGAELAAEAAISSEAPDADAKTDAMLEAAPADIKGAIEAALANAESGAGDPAFDEPYGELMAFMVDECGAAEQPLTVTDDGLDGPAEVEAGPTVFNATNDGTEPQVTLLVRLADGSTADDLVGLTPDEALQAGTVLSGSFLAPGVSSHLIADVTPGTYAIVGFAPTGDPVAQSHLLELKAA